MRAMLLVLALAASACRYPNADGRFDLAQDADGDGFNADVDCDDDDADVNPDAEEVCNGVDDDCDGDVDVGASDPSTFWVDADGDGFGNDDLATVQACDAPDGYAPVGGDCDDTDKDYNPDAIDIADDGIDQDCNGHDTVPCFKDEDEDGFGNDDLVTVLADDGSCDTDQGESDNSLDCDDDDPLTNPDGIDLPNDLIDQDCTGAPAIPCWTDADGDEQGNVALPLVSDTCDADAQATNDDDCDDTDATVKLGATELCDGQLNACGGTMLANEGNVDGDAFVACALDVGGWDGAGTVTGGNDCDDTDVTVFPGAAELCDGQLNNCGGTMLADEGNADGDAFVACALDAGGWDGAGTVTGGEDCDDTPPNGATIFPGAPELCDGVDNNCDEALTDLEDDDDADGFIECVVDAGGWDGDGAEPGAGLDCDDAFAQTFPGAPELCDGVDNDCDVDESIADENGRASFEPAAPGPWIDVTALLIPDGARGAATASANGTLWLCGATDHVFYATLTVPGTVTSFTIEGRDTSPPAVLSGTEHDTDTRVARMIDHAGTGSLTLRRLTLRDGGSGAGGAVRFAGAPTEALIDDCTIEGSVAAGGGGGIFLAGGSLEIRATTLSDNLASTGGHVSMSAGTLLVDADSVLQTGRAGSGGALHVTSGTATVEGEISDNDADLGSTLGGGIYLEAGTLMLDGATLTGNTAVGSGGGLYIAGGSADLSGATFTGNSAAFGGGLHLQGGTISGTTMSFVDNTAGSGGAMYLAANTASVLNDLTATGNTATGTGFSGGGAIAISEADLDVIGCSITDNHATLADGGALLMDRNTGLSSAEFTDCVISGNTAADEGGAIAVAEESDVGVTDTSITDNEGLQSGAVDLNAVFASFTCTDTVDGVGEVKRNVATGSSANAANYAGGVHLAGDSLTSFVTSAGCDWGTGLDDNTVDSASPLAADIGSNDVPGMADDGYRVNGVTGTFTCTAAATCLSAGSD